MSDDKYNVVVDSSRADNWNKKCDECGDKAKALWVRSHARGASLSEMCDGCSKNLIGNGDVLKIGDYDRKINIFGL